MIKMSVAAKPFTKEEGDAEEIFEQNDWPVQGEMIGESVQVHYSQGVHEGTLTGEIIRHDEESPFLIIVSLPNDRFILNRPLEDLTPCTECGGAE